MNRRTISLALTTSLAVGAVSAATAQKARTATSPVVPSQEQPAIATNSDEQNARDWGLRPEEWTRYQEVMRGPLGIF